MKHIILLFSLIFLSATAHPVWASYASHPAAATSNTQITNEASAEQSLTTEKGGFFKKLMAKRAVKKVQKALKAMSGDDGGLVAILAYLTIIGFVVALVMHMDDKTSLGGFHLAQVLGNIILGAIVGAISVVLGLIPFGGLVSLALVILILINWLAGIIAAFQGEEKHMPILGKLFDEKLRSLFD